MRRPVAIAGDRSRSARLHVGAVSPLASLGGSQWWPVVAALVLAWTVLLAGGVAASDLALARNRTAVTALARPGGDWSPAANDLYRAWTAVVAPVRPELAAEAARDAAARARLRTHQSAWAAAR